jgi:hypothetical protein
MGPKKNIMDLNGIDTIEKVNCEGVAGMLRLTLVLC